jgi:hypothetical protein
MWFLADLEVSSSQKNTIVTLKVDGSMPQWENKVAFDVLWHGLNGFLWEHLLGILMVYLIQQG